MSYGTIKVDTITFTDNSVDKSVSLSGLIQNPTFTGNITVTGTISGDVIRGGTTVSGATVTGTTANFVSGVFTTQISGVTVTGTTASFTSGVFTNISGTTATITSGIIASGTAAAPSLAILADLDTGLFSPGANQLAVATNGTGRLFVDASGNVGIGASPSSLLWVRGGAATATISSSTNTSNLDITNNTQTTRLGAINADFSIAHAGSERLRITSTGLVGIGTSTPSALLHVSSTGAVESLLSGGGTSGDTVLHLKGNGNAYKFIVPNSAAQYGMGLYDVGNAAYRLYVTSAGNVGVGTTSPSLAFVVSNSGAQGFEVQKNSGTLSGGIELISYNRTTSAYSPVLYDASFHAFGISNSEKARIDSSGRVGIGTSGPSSQLDVRGSATDFDGLRVLNTNSGSGTQTSAAIRLGITNSFGAVNGIRNCRIQATENNTDSNDVHLDFYTNSAVGLDQETVKMRLTAGGALGIGTTSPRRRLEVSGADGLLCINATDTSTGTSQLLFGDNDDDNIGRIYYDHGTDNMAFWTNTSEKARIDTSGRLLVGTSSARANMFNATLSSAFQVEGTTHNTSSVSIVRNSNDASAAAFVLGKSRGAAAGSSTLVSNNDTIAYLSFQGADGSELVECASIAAYVDGTPGANDMPGRLVFSTTADGASSPTERIRLSNAGLSSFYGTLGVIYSRSATGAGTAERVFLGYHSASSVITGTISINIFTNGNITNTNNSYGAISDLKLKENIVDATSQWSDIKALQVRKYNFKEETGQETHTQIGLVAQEVELVSPGLVSESPDRDEDGNDLGTVTKSVNYSVLYMKAVKALQEAIAKIETLEGMVAVNNITIDEQQHQLSTLAARLTALESA
jgi:hypothetical protein